MAQGGEWLYMQDGQQLGPVAESAIRLALKAGTIASNTLVWAPPMAEWIPASAAFGTDVAAQAPAHVAQNGWATAWVVTSLVSNVAFLGINTLRLILVFAQIAQNQWGGLHWAFFPNGVVSLLGALAAMTLNLVFTIPLFWRKRWAFKGVMVTATLSLIWHAAPIVTPFNFMSVDNYVLLAAAMAIIGPVALYAALRFGSPDSVSAQLR